MSMKGEQTGELEGRTDGWAGRENRRVSWKREQTGELEGRTDG